MSDFILPLDPVTPKATFIPALPQSIRQERPLFSLHWFGLCFYYLQTTESQLLFVTHKYHDFQKVSRKQFTQEIHANDPNWFYVFSLEHHSNSYFSALPI